MPEIGSPVPLHAAREEGGVFYLTPTAAFLRRDRVPRWVALTSGPAVLGLVAWRASQAASPGVAVALWAVAAIGAVYLLCLLIPAPSPPDPLVLTRAGRIEYRGAVLQPGPVTEVRVVGHSDYEIVDTFHIECAGPAGVSILPSPGFQTTERGDALMPVAAWLADLFGVPAPTAVEMRARAVESP